MIHSYHVKKLTKLLTKQRLKAQGDEDEEKVKIESSERLEHGRLTDWLNSGTISCNKPNQMSTFNINEISCFVPAND